MVLAIDFEEDVFVLVHFHCAFFEFLAVDVFAVLEIIERGSDCFFPCIEVGDEILGDSLDDEVNVKDLFDDRLAVEFDSEGVEQIGDVEGAECFGSIFNLSLDVLRVVEVREFGELGHSAFEFCVLRVGLPEFRLVHFNDYEDMCDLHELLHIGAVVGTAGVAFFHEKELFEELRFEHVGVAE